MFNDVEQRNWAMDWKIVRRWDSMAGGWIRNGQNVGFGLTWETGDTKVCWAMRPFIGWRVEDNRSAEMNSAFWEKKSVSLCVIVWISDKELVFVSGWISVCVTGKYW